jgi:hypothetical protein
MISGMYLGEIARLIATDLIAKDILFAGQAHAVRPPPIPESQTLFASKALFHLSFPFLSALILVHGNLTAISISQQLFLSPGEFSTELMANIEGSDNAGQVRD